MAFFFSPIGNTQIIDANGNPLVGGTIETYLAGTSTPRTTYTDDTGGTAQGVVMTLNSLGYPTNGPVWMQSGIPLKFIIKNAAGVTQSTFDDVSGIGDTSNITDEWLLHGAAPTYISATSFSVVGDQTNTFQVSRRLKSTNTGGTVYSTITISAFAAGITTVTVLNTSGVLDAGLSAVSYGVLAATNQSLPGVYTTLTPGGLPDASVLTADIADANVTPTKLSQPYTRGTAQATTSGTAINFTDIPSWVKTLFIPLSLVSGSGSSNLLLLIGDPGGLETSGYSGGAVLPQSGTATSGANSTVGFVLTGGNGASLTHDGCLRLDNISGTTWVLSGALLRSDTGAGDICGGSKTLTGTLDRFTLTYVNGTDTFDGGSANWFALGGV